MPSPDFFRNLGLFVRRNFLSPEICLQIIEQMRATESKKAPVYAATLGGDVLDESKRKALLSIHLEPSTKAMVRDQIMALKPALKQHFRLELTDIEKLGFLRYGEGSFHTPHFDTHPNQSPDMVRRRVSVVVFLNGSSTERAPNAYLGGSLTFYGLIDGPEWEKCAFALDAEPGLLIAFRPDTLHEVQPVLFGERFTIVTWFWS